MSTPKTRRSIAILCIAIAIALAACTTRLTGKAITGQIITGPTNSPVAGAIVVAFWEGDVRHFPESSTYCYHVLSTTLDDKGTYRFPAWAEKISRSWQRDIINTQVHVFVYYPGHVGDYHILAGSHAGETTLRVSPDAGSTAERFKYLLRLSTAATCLPATAGPSVRNLGSFDEAVYKELKSLARSREEIERIRFVREKIAIDANADYQDSEQMRQGIRKYLEDHPE
jgi:hypothetical protein